MEKGFRLLERIELGEAKRSFEREKSTRHLVDSIHLHLADLLNTHAGNALIDEEYGLPDFNDVLAQQNNLVRHIQANIQETIESFEPRMQNVKVTHIEDENSALKLSFSISGEVLHNGSDVPMAISVFMGIDGQFNI
ncbi:type VI secretion system baseplate subunit TssE [Vibrio sp.]|nr:type VI secretion system baseplate subunit TssE [Vibrio sp.]